MKERYSRLYMLPEKIYANGAPLVIAAGALLKDNQTGKILAQIKMLNISSKVIKAVTIRIHPKDTTGTSLGEDVEYQYLDLNIVRGGEFGQKQPIAMPNKTTREFSAEVIKVVFNDNSLWNARGGEWERIPSATALGEKIKDVELRKQYGIEFGNKSKFIYTRHKDLWYCACGTLNKVDEENCYNCGLSEAVLFGLDWSALEADKAQRLEAEAKAADAKAIAAAKQIKKNKQIGIVAAAVCVMIAAILIVTQIIIPNSKYKAAEALFAAGQYEEAIIAFEALEDYKDSIEQIEKGKTAIKDQAYDAAVALMDSGQYEEAIVAFEALIDYKDSAEQAEWADLEAKYRNAEEFYAAGRYEEAITAFTEIESHRDSASKIQLTALVYADEFKEAGDSANAIEWYEKAGAMQSANEVRYDYVLANKNSEDEATYEYLVALMEADYEDAGQIYAELYKLEAELFINTDHRDNSTDLDTIPYGSGVTYVHYKITGGPPTDTVSIRILEENRLKTILGTIEPYKEERQETEVVEKGNYESFVFHTGSNLVYHRLTIYDAVTGEQLAQDTVYTPFYY